MTRRPARSLVRCPVCRSQDLALTESVWATTTWTVTGGRLDRNEGFHEPGGADHVDARCGKCGHEWRPRGGRQITDLVIEDGERGPEWATGRAAAELQSLDHNSPQSRK